MDSESFGYSEFLEGKTKKGRPRKEESGKRKKKKKSILAIDGQNVIYDGVILKQESIEAANKLYNDLIDAFDLGEELEKI